MTISEQLREHALYSAYAYVSMIPGYGAFLSAWRFVGDDPLYFSEDENDIERRTLLFFIAEALE